MTPREYYRESEAAEQRWKDEQNRDLALAWTVAALSAQAQVGKLTDLKTMFEQRDGPRRTSREAQRQMLHFLSERYQIPLKVVH
jgi:predicted lipid carrier protein YhbT